MPAAWVFFFFAGGHYEYDVEAVGAGEWWFAVVGALGGLGDFCPPGFDVFGGFDHAAAADVAFGALWAGCAGDEALEFGHGYLQRNVGRCCFSWRYFLIRARAGRGVWRLWRLWRGFFMRLLGYK